jgi:hypothetical protein
MAIINTYPSATPKGADLLIGTQVKDDTVQENSTKSFTVDSLGSYILTSTSGITGSGTLNTIAMFTPDGQAIGDSIITQDAGATQLTVNGELRVSASIYTSSSLTVGGISTFNDDATFENAVNINDALYDQNSSPGTVGQVLSSTGTGNVEWIDNTAPGTVTGSGTTNTIPKWSDGPASVLGDSWLSQERIPGIAINYLNFEGPSGFENRLSITNGYIETNDLQVTNITAGDTGNIDFQGNTTLGNSTSDFIWHRGTTYLTGPVLDTSNTAGAAGQVLVSNATSNVEWKSYSDSGATFLGWARYDGTPSFSNGSEVTVTDGNFIDPPVSLVTNQVIDPYTNGASGKFVFTNDDLNAVYCLTAVFKASAANANQTHVDIDFISGATDYERLSKSVAFYKGNDTVQNFHEMYQFYVDSDLVTYGLQPRLGASGGSVKFGDVIFFIQKQQQPAI